jgi:hypothetical protein
MNITLDFHGRKRRTRELANFSNRERFLPSKTVADPSLPSRVKAHINVPKFNKNTILATATPARTANRQLPSCFVVSRSRVDDSLDMSPVCDVSLDSVVSSAIIASYYLWERTNAERKKETRIQSHS